MEEVENVWNTFSRYDPMDGGGRAKQEARAEANSLWKQRAVEGSSSW